VELIQLQDVNFVREERRILDNINLHIGADEHWAILGKNGSGKTTILELMTGYEFPSSGRIDVLGFQYGSCDVREVRRKIGYISQSLFEKLNPADPVWEVVATGEYAFLRFYETIPGEVIDKAREMLRRVKLDRVSDNPLGTLSQGERKKVMLARALMQDPEILIMDEPCSGLDLYEREKLLADINELRERRMTIGYVTHIEEIVPLFTHVGLLHEGKLIAAGEKGSVLTEELLMLAYGVKVKIEWFNERPWIKVL
jgi:iron complex transport system ATP-binding protein